MTHLSYRCDSFPPAGRGAGELQYERHSFEGSHAVESQRISHYRIIGKLGAGGMGEVFLAEDTKLDRKVAIKMLPEKSAGNEHARSRLVREAKAAATLDHSNICAIYEVGEEDDRTFIVMQYIEGETLSRKIKDNPLPVAEVIDIGLQSLGALSEAHARGIVHRDIKPHNVIITPRGQVKILDFGLAKFISELRPADLDAETEGRLTETGQVIGTPAYSSPEQLQGQKIDSRTDLFSLGVLLYECATGQHAFRGVTPIQVSLQVINSKPPEPSKLNPSIPADLDRVISKAMSKRLDARYQSADEMSEDLHRLQESVRARGEVGTRRLSSDSLRSAGLSIEPAKALAQRVANTSWRTRLILAGVAVLGVIAVWWAIGGFLPSENTMPAAARGYYDRGTASIREGSYYQASKAFERAVELAPNSPLAHARLADAYSEIDSTDRAREEMLMAISLIPDRSSLSSAEQAYLDAIAAMLNRDFSKAIQLYTELVGQVQEPEKAGAYVDLGRAHEKNEAIGKALEYYGKATQLDPQSAAGFLRTGILYARRQDQLRANEAFDQAQKIYDSLSSQEGLAEVHFQQGAFLARIGKLDEAKSHLDRALAIASSSANKFQSVKAHLQLSGVYYAKGDTELAKKTAEDAIDVAQTANIRNLSTNGLIDLGYTLLSRGEFAEAKARFEQALAFAQSEKARRIEARAKLALGGLKVQQDNPDEAISLLTEALKFFEPAGYRIETSNALILLARAYRSKGDYDVAQTTLNQQLELAKRLEDPTRVAASHSSLGVLMGVHRENYGEAVPHFDASYGINQSLKSIVGMGWDQMNRASMLWQLGRYAEATKALDEAYSIANRPEASYKSQLAWVLLTRAQMALSQGRHADAKAKAGESFKLSGNQYRDLDIEAKYTIGLAEARSGSVRSGLRLCEEAVTTAETIRSPRLLSTSLLALAEASLLANEGERALKSALQAQSMFGPAGQQDSEWRAWVIAARSSQRAGNTQSSLAYATRARERREQLRARWGAQVYEQYSRRTDIQGYSNQLEQALAQSK